MLVVVLAIVTVACRAETNLRLDVTETGAGTYTVEFGVDDELQQLLNEFTGEEGGLLPGFGSAVPGLEGNPLEDLSQRTEGDMTFYGTTQSFVDPAALATTVAEGGDASFEEFALVVGEEEITFRAKALPPDNTAGDFEDLPIDLGSISEEFFAANFLLALPGEVTSNADEVLADGTHRWTLSLTDGVDIEAVADLTPGGFPLWVVLVIVALLVILVAGIFFIWRRTPRDQAALESVDAPPPPVGFDEDIDPL